MIGCTGKIVAKLTPGNDRSSWTRDRQRRRSGSCGEESGGALQQGWLPYHRSDHLVLHRRWLSAGGSGTGR
jgi:hypothetical protein